MKKLENNNKNTTKNKSQKEEVLSKILPKIKEMETKELVNLCRKMNWNFWTNKTKNCTCCCNEGITMCIKCDGKEYLDFPF